MEELIKKLNGIVFVTGTDTDAGKTYVTGQIARKACESGINATTMKFVQTGCKSISEDITEHRRIMGIQPTSMDLLGISAPQIFSYPCSPDLAARLDGRQLDIHAIETGADELAKHHDAVLVEGAGGLMVPLKGQYLTIDFVREHKWPVILVTNGKLGSINHTLLSLYAIKHAGIDLAAVVYNTYFDKDKIIAEDSRKYIRHWTETHCHGTIYAEIGTVGK